MKKRISSVFVVICMVAALFSPSSEKSFAAGTPIVKNVEDKSSADKTDKASEDEEESEEADESSKEDAESDQSEESSDEDDTSDQSEDADEDDDFDGNLKIKDGTLLPMLNYSDLRDPEYSNESSDIQRFCVYVETDHDTDNDGMADLVKVFLQIPSGAVEGDFKAGTIYDPTPYNVGVVEQFGLSNDAALMEKPFDYKLLYNKGKKRKAAGEMTSAEAAEAANPAKDWNYSVPDTNDQGYSYAHLYDYYLVRGYAVVEASGIGTYGSEGYELCGRDLERDSHKCVVEWLTGDRVAYTDKENNIQIKADWANGNVAMTGCSYGGTLPFEVATTGVKGLKTIIPYAGIASWYDYTNSQGIAITSHSGYSDFLASFNCGALFLDDRWTVLDDGYRSWLWQISQDEEKCAGNYGPIWAESDYSHDYEKINCAALIVHGLNDFNVTTKQAMMMYNVFKKADKPVKMLLHQNGHGETQELAIDGEPWLETQNKWLAHYLYDVNNDIENMSELTVQSNLTGEFTRYDSFGEYQEGKVSAKKSGDVTEVSSAGIMEYTQEIAANGTLIDDMKEDFFMGLSDKNAAVYDIEVPKGATISGTPEIHLKLSTNTVNLDKMMVTAVLIDSEKDGELFKAYLTKNKLHDRLPVKTVDEFDAGGGLDPFQLQEFVPSTTSAKCFSYGWTDLTNPGCGPDQAEYTETVKLESGKYYDYTIYMTPTIYTFEKDHQLKLVLMTWDPFRVTLDENFNIDMSLLQQRGDENYSYVIDNSSLDVRLPLISK
jgi:X-Pro dipeptidyl-peptidase